MRDTATLVVQKALVYLTGHDVISQTEFDPGSLIAGAALVLLYDGHGSTRFVTNVNAAIVEGYNYDAYGNAIGFDTATALTSLLCSGEQEPHRTGGHLGITLSSCCLYYFNIFEK